MTNLDLFEDMIIRTCSRNICRIVQHQQNNRWVLGIGYLWNRRRWVVHDLFGLHVFLLVRWLLFFFRLVQ